MQIDELDTQNTQENIIDYKDLMIKKLENRIKELEKKIDELDDRLEEIEWRFE